MIAFSPILFYASPLPLVILWEWDKNLGDYHFSWKSSPTRSSENGKKKMRLETKVSPSYLYMQKKKKKGYWLLSTLESWRLLPWKRSTLLCLSPVTAVKSHFSQLLNKLPPLWQNPPRKNLCDQIQNLWLLGAHLHKLHAIKRPWFTF